MTSIPLAHPGHWIADSLYALPVVILALALWVQSIRDKRKARSEQESGEERRKT